MRLKRKLYANITSSKLLTPAKETINVVVKKASGIHNNSIANSSREAAKHVSKVTGDSINGYLVENSRNRVGNTVFTNIKKKPRKSTKSSWCGELFNEVGAGNQKPKKVKRNLNNNQEQPTKSKDSNDLARKFLEKKKFDRMRKRASNSTIEKDGTVTGKLVKTDGSSRIIMKGQRTLLTDPKFTKGTGFEIDY